MAFKQLIVLVILMNYAGARNIRLKFDYDQLLKPTINVKCEKDGFCRDVSNYPDDLATRLFDELKSKNVTKFVIEKDYFMNADYKTLCSEKEKIFYPRVAKNKDNIWHFILNPVSAHFQGFQVEMCRNIGICSNPLVADSTYVINCTQSVTYKLMVYLDMERQMLDVDHFAVPNCCSCFAAKY